MNDKIVRSEHIRAQTLDTNDPAAPEVGKWYRIQYSDGSEPRLACIVHLGSNYAEFEDVYGSSNRVHLDTFWDKCEWIPDPDSYIESEIARYQKIARELIQRVKEITARLSISSNPTLSTNSETQALALHRSEPVEEYKAALILAQKETLPKLFEEIKQANSHMGLWMKAKLIPLKAQAQNMSSVVETIENRIFNVELYAGLVEKIEQVRDGEPAPLTEKIHLIQRRAYMDEECLAQYKTGGMDIRNIEAFDAWLAESENFERLLPFKKSIIAFQVRRHTKEREIVNLSDFIQIMGAKDQDKYTFLYIRNGEKLFRMRTGVEFDENLFPDMNRQQLAGKLWAEMFAGEVRSVISDDQYQGILEEEALKEKELRKVPKKDRWVHSTYKKSEDYVHYSPENVYYDDISKFIGNVVNRHNRLVLIMQGLLDRSPVLHPHPPWLLWTNEGFQQALELVYDSSRSLTTGEPPNFEEYRARLNQTLRAGSITVGQEVAWEISEARRENERLDKDYRNRSNYRHERFKPYGNPGPGVLAYVVRWAPKSKKCTYHWMRERLGQNSLDDQKEILTAFTCSSEYILNVDAYKPGDFKIFFNDPRTRASYLKWAPLLLEAEEYHAGNGKVVPITPPGKKEKDPQASRDYQIRKFRRSWLGKAVRLTSPLTTKSGKVYPKGSLWRVTKGIGNLFTIEGITEDGMMEKEFRIVYSVHYNSFSLDPNIPPVKDI